MQLVTPYWTLQDIGISLLKDIFLGGGNQLSATWFVVNLFEISVLFCCLDFLYKHLCKHKSLIFQGIISITFLLVGYYCGIHDIKLYGVPRILSCYALFYLGYLIRVLHMIVSDSGMKEDIFRLLTGLFALVILSGIGSVELSRNEYTNPLYLLVCSLIGGMFVYETAKVIQKFSCFEQVFRRCGEDSLSILILHFLSFKIVNCIGVLVEKRPSYFIAAFPVLYTGRYIWVIYTVTGLGVPILCKALKNKIIGYKKRKNYMDW